MSVKLSTLSVGDKFMLKRVNMGISPKEGIMLTLDEKGFYMLSGKTEYYVAHENSPNGDQKYLLDPNGLVEKYEQ